MPTCILLALYSMYLKLCKKNRLNRHKRTLARQLRHLAWQKTIAQTKLRRYMYVIYYSCLQLANMNLYLSLRTMYVLMLRRGLSKMCWRKHRSTHWWSEVVDGMYDDWWMDNFRMCRDTFSDICMELAPHIQREVIRFRLPISVPARVAITIWKLATNTECRTISVLFGIGKSTVHEVLHDTCAVVASHIMPKYVHIPNMAMLRIIVNGFEHNLGFPQAIGVIDGSHIAIIKPHQCASDCFNRKSYYSILVQAFDFRGLYMDVNIGWPGKVHDARVFSNSSCFKKGDRNILFPHWPRSMSGIDVPLLVLGDSAYLLLLWLMKPYLENALTTLQEQIFNYRQSRARMVVENALVG